VCALVSTPCRPWSSPCAYVGPVHATGGIRAPTRTRRLAHWHATVTCCTSLPPQTASQSPMTTAAWRPSLPGLPGRAPVLTGCCRPKGTQRARATFLQTAAGNSRAANSAGCQAARQPAAESTGSCGICRVHVLDIQCCTCQADVRAARPELLVAHHTMVQGRMAANANSHCRTLMQQTVRCTLCSHAAVLSHENEAHGATELRERAEADSSEHQAPDRLQACLTT
jgi:hypothetical protein